MYFDFRGLLKRKYDPEETRLEIGLEIVFPDDHASTLRPPARQNQITRVIATFYTDAQR